MSVPSSAEGEFGRAIDLMEAAGWIDRRSSDDLLIGIKMTPDGQKRAQIFLMLFKELKCDPRDLPQVLGFLTWYLNNESLN
jgi:hypothetical protein